MTPDQLALEPEVIAVSSTTPEETSSFERKDLISISNEADKRIDAIKKIIVTALKVTNPFDWVSQGYGEKSRPYLCSSGAEKIANLFRVKISDTRAEKFAGHDDKGEYYFYVYTCKASLPDGHSVETEGTCSSRDQFFAQSGKDAEGKPIFKPLSEVDETNIRKAAHSNMVVRAITSLLGLRNLSWEQLQQAGIDTAKMGVVEYKAKTNGASSPVFISEAQRNRLFAIQKGTKVTESQLMDHLASKYQINSTKEIKRGDYEAIVNWVQNGGK